MTSHSRWVDLLVDHVLARGTSQGPVTRIRAIPRELCLAFGMSDEAIEEASADGIRAVVDDFALAISKELKSERKSFVRYCTEYKREPWFSPDTDETPYFFAALWLTCLVANGYPYDGDGDFGRRMKAVLGASVQLSPTPEGGLDEVWEDLAAWTRNNPQYRELILPPRCAHRTNIGRSHFLAFPRWDDRVRLAKLLQGAGFVGQDPPVATVLALLQQEATSFSKDFRKDLDTLFQGFLAKHRDPKDSPFWRVIRQELQLGRSFDDDAVVSSGSAVLLWERDDDDDDLFVPFLGYDPDLWTPPEQWDSSELLEPMGTLSHRASPEDSGLEALLANPREYFQGLDARALEQGVVPLLEERADIYRVADSEEVEGSDVALVRDSLVAQVEEVFGGQTVKSLVPGWQTLLGVRFKHAGAGALAEIVGLQSKTNAPIPRLVGGLRVGKQHLLLEGAHGYLPRVQASGAESVEVMLATGGRIGECVLDSSGEFWHLPLEVAEHVGGELRVEATYTTMVLEYSYLRRASCRLALRSHLLQTDYKGVPSGNFRRETCRFGLDPVTGPTPRVESIGTSDLADVEPHEVVDTLLLEPTVRWLGPRFGEMSLSPDHRWFAVGAKKGPDFLVADASSVASIPPPDSGSRSPDGGDRRHYHSAFSKAKQFVWKRDGVYVPLEEWPDKLVKLLRAYEKNRPRSAEPTVEPTRLDDRVPDPDWGKEPLPASSALAAVLAALGSNRAGLPLSEVRDHIARTCDLHDAHVVRQHLVRALADAGAIEVLRRADGRGRIVVPRRPRFVVTRRGPQTVATLVGLAPPTLLGQLEKQARVFALPDLTYLRGPSRLLPSVPRVTVADPSMLVHVAKALCLAPTEYLMWPDPTALPEAFRVTGELRSDPPPGAYEREAEWCWSAEAFRSRPADVGTVSIQRRKDGKRVPIYVVLRDGTLVGWSYSRTWALIGAHDAAGRPFLRHDSKGLYLSEGRSPVHLPLPHGRLCAVLGMGLPGPVLSRIDGQLHVESYAYPFGPQLRRLLVPHLPKSWLAH